MDKSQSPYKGFNSFERQVVAVKKQRLNPPIRGSIVIRYKYCWYTYCLNPPIRGSIENLRKEITLVDRINPPIRGSIEQDNALFENYNHKR